MKTMSRSYSELLLIPTFLDRFRYLCLQGSVGELTFGFERYLNQNFYKSRRWRQVRDLVIIRDNGLDLGVEGYEIHDQILVHHMNPVTIEDIQREAPWIYDPDGLITTCKLTHQAIHYSDETLLPRSPIERRSGDTCPWR